MGRDTFLKVQDVVSTSPVKTSMLERKLKLAAQQSGDRSKEIAALQTELEKTMSNANEEEEYADFQAVPPSLTDWKVALLPNSLKNFHKRVGSPEQNIKLGKEVIIALYEGAKRAGGDHTPVAVPHPMFLSDLTIKEKIAWQDMVIVDEDSWHDKPVVDEVLNFEPSLVQRNELDDLQAQIYDEMATLSEIAEYIYYWGLQGRTLGVEYEINN